METRRQNRQGAGPPVFTYVAAPGSPLVSVGRLGRGFTLGEAAGPHSHDFLTLVYFERGDGVLRSGSRRWEVVAGDLFLISPGEVHDASGLGEAEGWLVFFPAEVIGAASANAHLAWRGHPLLFPFVRGSGTPEARHLSVPPENRSSWAARLSGLEAELTRREEGYRDAALAHLTLLLVEVARLSADVVGGLRLSDEPLLARVFGFIEQHYNEPISLKDVARAVNLSASHLTTVVGRKTGRTVLGWIVERRLAEARRLLVETDIAVGEVGRRVGYEDPAYFARSFRRAYGITPLSWRRADRP